MHLTIQVHWDHQWHDAGTVGFRTPALGLGGRPSFTYHTEYALKALERVDDLEKEDLVDQTAISLNLPCNFFRDYPNGEVAPVLRDIIPQGAARRHWVKLLGYNRDPEQRIDTRLLSLGCTSPVGNLRIKEAADLFEPRAEKAPAITFDRSDIYALADDVQQYASHGSHLIAGALGAGGDAPKLLLVETRDGRYAFEGTVPDREVLQHWLVKLPRGKKTKADVQVLEGEAAIYRLLSERDFNSIPGSFFFRSEGGDALWLPRFDRLSTPEGIVRHGVESIYSLMGQAGDGARLCHSDIIARLRECVKQPTDEDAILADYLVRDILNTAMGNRDNHGRNMSLLKKGSGIELAPAYDVAPMILDPEGIASSTWWPHRLLNKNRKPDYRAILIDHATHPEATASHMIQALKKLTNLKEGLRRHGAPAEMLNHRAIRMHEPELVLEELGRWIDG